MKADKTVLRLDERERKGKPKTKRKKEKEVWERRTERK